MRRLLFSLLLLTTPGLAQSPAHIQTANAPFATAVRAGNMLCISGQIPSADAMAYKAGK